MKTYRQLQETGEIRTYLNQLAAATKDVMPSMDGDPDHVCGFAIMVVDTSDVSGSGQNTAYVSTLNRKDMIQALRELADRLEANADDRHEKEK